MPLSESRSTTEREYADVASRAWSEWLIGVLYRVSGFLLAVAAVGVAVYAFTVSYGEGARSIIFFVVPSMWGAYVLAIHDGKPKAVQELSASIANSLAVIAGLVVASVLFLDTPVSITNLALGAMEAFFFMMRISTQPTAYLRRYSPTFKVLVRAFLIMVTVICAVIAIAV